MRSQLGCALLLGVAITIAMASGASGQNYKKPAIDEVFLLATRPTPDFTADFRAKFAESLASYCQEVMNALPTNTPAEDGWVASEQRTGNGAKRVLNSKEYSRSILKEHFSDCRDTTTMLIKIQNLDEKERSSKVEEYANLEAGRFVRLALIFNSNFERQSSMLELNKDLKFALGDFSIQAVRWGLLKAATRALQDVH